MNDEELFQEQLRQAIQASLDPSKQVNPSAISNYSLPNSSQSYHQQQQRSYQQPSNQQQSNHNQQYQNGHNRLSSNTRSFFSSILPSRNSSQSSPSHSSSLASNHPSNFSLPQIGSGNCFSCSRPIAGQTINYNNAKYHVECFTCDGCKKPFEMNSSNR